MKAHHILNIGYPKCGTTWCWDSLSLHPWFSQPREKENYDLISRTKTVEEYVYDYKKYDITANFCPAMFAVDRYIIQQLSEIPTISVSLIVRNPFDIYWSLYNFLKKSTSYTFNQYVKNHIEQGWFNRTSIILQRWSNAFGPDRIKIFFYDDLVSNQKLFIDNYFIKMNLPACTKYIAEPSNVTKYQNKTLPDIDAETKSIINQDIKNLQSMIDKNIQHWLK